MRVDPAANDLLGWTEEARTDGVDVGLVIGEAMIHTWPFFAEARYRSRCVGVSITRKKGNYKVDVARPIM